MKEKATNSVTNFQAESITENISVEFTRIVEANNTTIAGSLMKDGEQVGDVSYDRKGDFQIVRIKPFSALTEDEMGKVYSSIPEYIKEMLS